MHGCDAVVSEVDAYLGQPPISERHANRFDMRKPAAGFPDAPGNPARKIQVRAVQVDIEGDQELACADCCCPCAGMQLRLAKVRRSLGESDLLLKRLELPPPDDLQPPALRAKGSFFVEVDRDARLSRKTLCKRSSQGDRISHLGVAKRDERDNVHCADPGVCAPVVAQVDCSNGRPG